MIRTLDYPDVFFAWSQLVQIIEVALHVCTCILERVLNLIDSYVIEVALFIKLYRGVWNTCRTVYTVSESGLCVYCVWKWPLQEQRPFSNDCHVWSDARVSFMGGRAFAPPWKLSSIYYDCRVSFGGGAGGSISLLAKFSKWNPLIRIWNGYSWWGGVVFWSDTAGGTTVVLFLGVTVLQEICTTAFEEVGQFCCPFKNLFWPDPFLFQHDLLFLPLHNLLFPCTGPFFFHATQFSCMFYWYLHVYPRLWLYYRVCFLFRSHPVLLL